MKTKSFLSILACAGMLLASCAQDELTKYDPSNAKTPVLGTVENAVLTADSPSIVISFEGAEFGLDVAKKYTLQASRSEDFADAKSITASIESVEEGYTATIKAATLNSFIINIGGVPEEEFTLYFRLVASIANEKGTAITVTDIFSNIVSAVFTPYNQLMLDKDVYDHIFIQGNYAGWNFANCQLLYNYNKDGNTFEGVADFGEKAADGVKFTGIADWGNETGNWGATGDEEAETTTFKLSNGSNSNFTCWSKRFYHFTVDKGSLTGKVDWSADKIGIIGLNGNWDDDIDMNYNVDFVRFWADVTVSADTEFKFRADGDWGFNWGEDLKMNAGNIAIEAGSYRIYLDLNKKTLDINAAMFGKDEPTATGSGEGEDEPSGKPSVWSIAGTINEWNKDDESTQLTEIADDLWVIRNFSLSASDEFKILADHDWSECYGGPEANSTSTVSPDNPYEVFKPVLGTAFDVKGLNIQVGEEGFFDITFNYAKKTITIERHAEIYSLIGEIEGGKNWTYDFPMVEKDGIWTSAVVNITGGFKIRYNNSWADADCYGVAEGETVEIGTAFVAVQPGANISVPAGEYKVSLNPSTKEVTIFTVDFPETMYMIGQQFGSWDWDSDDIVSLVPVFGKEGQFWTVRWFNAADPFKFCSKRAWNGDFFSLGTNEGFVAEGGNCLVETDGFYLVHIDLKRDILHIEPARIYGIGDCFGKWDAKMDDALFTAENKTLKTTLKNDGQLRMYVESDIADSDWWTREFVILDGKIAYRGNGEDQERVSCTAGQTVVLDFNAGTGNIQ